MITAHDAAQSGDWKTFFASCLSDPMTYQQKQISFEESLELDYDTLEPTSRRIRTRRIWRDLEST